MELLERLIKAFGISGNEDDVRDIIQKEIKKYVNDFYIDKVGNLIAHKKGKSPKVMLAAHMDEIGFMVKGITNEGNIRCSYLGGFLDMVMLGQIVNIKTKKGKINGVITTKEISNDHEVKEIPKTKDLIVDTGLTRKELIDLGVGPGAYLPLESDFRYLGNKYIISGKALDDRIGCFVLIELARLLKKVKNEIFYVFTVQEEVGLYGAKASAYAINPDWSIVIDVTNANDCNYENATKFLGRGPCLTIKDEGMIANRKLNEHIIQIAKKNKIPIQLEVSDFGDSDALIISISRGGVPATVVCVPVRNLHTPIGIANKDDIDNTIKLLQLLFKHPPKIV